MTTSRFYRLHLAIPVMVLASLAPAQFVSREHSHSIGNAAYASLTASIEAGDEGSKDGNKTMPLTLSRPSWFKFTPPFHLAAPAAAPQPVLPEDDQDQIQALSEIREPAERKERFIDLISPEIDTANAEVLKERAKLAGIAYQITRDRDISSEDASWLKDLSVRYETDEGDIQELMNRVDLVPPSLALSQAALESGWGTSRLARDHLALFGQTNGGNGYAEFESLSEGVASYIRNLNTHPAYTDFRQARAAMRAAGKAIDGYELASHLTSYSELGQGYIKKVRSLMKFNDLHLVQEVSMR